MARASWVFALAVAALVALPVRSEYVVGLGYTSNTVCAGTADNIGFQVGTCAPLACSITGSSSYAQTCANSFSQIPLGSGVYFSEVFYAGSTCSGDPQYGEIILANKCFANGDGAYEIFVCSGNSFSQLTCTNSACTTGCTTTYTNSTNVCFPLSGGISAKMACSGSAVLAPALATFLAAVAVISFILI